MRDIKCNVLKYSFPPGLLRRPFQDIHVLSLFVHKVSVALSSIKFKYKLKRGIEEICHTRNNKMAYGNLHSNVI